MDYLIKVEIYDEAFLVGRKDIKLYFQEEPTEEICLKRVLDHSFNKDYTKDFVIINDKDNSNKKIMYNIRYIKKILIREFKKVEK